MRYFNLSCIEIFIFALVILLWIVTNQKNFFNFFSLYLHFHKFFQSFWIFVDQVWVFSGDECLLLGFALMRSQWNWEFSIFKSFQKKKKCIIASFLSEFNFSIFELWWKWCKRWLTSAILHHRRGDSDIKITRFIEIRAEWYFLC